MEVLAMKWMPPQHDDRNVTLNHLTAHVAEQPSIKLSISDSLRG